MNRSRVLIIGLDGADPDLVEAWIDHLPNLREFFAQGVSGKLRSITPPVTCPAWISFATGKNPGTLGIYDWEDFQPPQKPGLSNWKVPRHLKIWQLLGNAGYKVGIVNVPLTYPPEPVNGIMIAGFPSPPSVKDYVYPPQLMRQISSIVGNYDPDPAGIINPDYLEGGPRQFLEEVDKASSNVFSCAKYLMGSFDWDFFMITFMCLDQVQHYFWRYLDERHPDYRPREAEEFGSAILAVYKKIDNLLGSLLSLIDENACVFIMSDHGSGPQYGNFAINEWLAQEGLLTLKSKRPLKNIVFSILDSIFQKLLTSVLIRKTFRRFGWFRLGRRLVRRRFGLINPENPLWAAQHLFEDTDWYRTKALGLSNGKIYLNKQVLSTKDQYERVREEVMSSLCEIRDPLTGKQAVSKLFTKEQLYGIDCAGNPPDIIYFLGDLKYNQISGIKSPSLWQIPALRCGEHRLDGLYAAKGLYIKAGARINSRIIDLAPTILHIFGLPVPEDMDGRVLKEMFEDGSEPGKREVKYRVWDEKDRIRNKIRKLRRSDKI
ncbi:MAG: alkaline phosphatase family protein [Candidatus Hodarchaeota archaeon]